MTRGPFTCFDLIQDELESQYRGKILSQKYILGTLYNKVCNTYFIVFLKSYPILYTSETIFTFGTICRTHFKLIEMKNLKNVLKSTLRGENKKKQSANKLQKSGNLNVN